MVGLGRIAYSLERDPYRSKPCTHAGTLLSAWGRKHFQITGIMDKNPSAVSDFLEFYAQSFPRKSGSNSRSKFRNPSRLGSGTLPRVWSPEEVTKLPKGSRGKQADRINQGERENQGKQGNRAWLENPGEWDLAVVATHSESHFSLAEELILRGVPNLLIEKPVALDLPSARKLGRLAKKHSVRIWVNHERRYHPVYHWAYENLKKKTWGEIRTIRASVLTSAMDPGAAFSGTGGGVLYHDGTHAVDFLEWVLGRPRSITARSTKSKVGYKSAEQVLAWLDYKRAQVFLEVGGYRRYFQFEIDIQTSEARLVLSNDGFSFSLAEKSKLYKGFRSLQSKPGKIPKFTAEKDRPFRRVYSSILSSIQENLPVETGSIEDNIRIMEILDGIQKSGKTTLF